MSFDFEWDTEKEIVNIKKHGVDFTTAAAVFLDDNRIEFYDETHSCEEDRYITIGISIGVITVVYTVRDPNIHIISARYADKAEKELYYGKKEICFDR